MIPRIVPCIICFSALICSFQVKISCCSCNSWAHSSCLAISHSSALNLVVRRPWRCLKCLVPVSYLLSASVFQPSVGPFHPVNYLICYANIRSLVSNFEHVSRFLYVKKPLIIGFTETWLTTSLDSGEFNIANYNLFRKDRSHKSGGGVCFYISDQLSAEVCVDDLNSEILTVKILNHPHLGSFSVCYRPPNLNSATDECFWSDAVRCLTRAHLSNKLSCLGGDFNTDFFNPDPRGSDFIDFSKGFGFSQSIDSATRVTDTCSKTLDWILVNRPSTPAVVPSIGLSDHFTTQISVPYANNFSKASPVSGGNCNFAYRDFSKTNWDGVNSYLSSPPAVVYSNNVNLASLVFIRFFQFLLALFTPIVYAKTKRSRPPWFSKAISKLIKSKTRSFISYSSCPSPGKWIKYCRLRNAVVAASRLAKANFLRSLTDPKKFWAFYRQKRATSTPFSNSLSKNDSITLAEKLNDDFVVKPTYLSFPDAAPTVSRVESPSFSVFSIEKLLLKSKLKNSVGVDGIPAVALKSCAMRLAPILTHIFNLSLLTSIFPSIWKDSIVIPIPKDSLNSSFRPISLISNFAKCFETAVSDYLNSSLIALNCCSPRQFGFSRGKSTADALLFVTSLWHSFLNSTMYVLACFFDCSKAFDALSHHFIVFRLREIGFSDSFSAWVFSYLTNRRQKVKVGNFFSSFRRVCSGVPQGSILGPTLFKLSIDSLLSLNIGESVISVLYADDLCIFKPYIYRLCFSSFQSSIDMIAAYFDYIGLNLNPSKSKVLVISNIKNIFPNSLLYINNALIERVETVKYLGILISSNLRFSDHACFLIKKSSKLLGFLYRNFRNCSVKTKSILVNSLFLSCIDYCLPSYFPYCIKLRNRLDRLCIKMSLFIHNRSSSAYPVEGWASGGISGRFFYLAGCAIYRHLAGLANIPSVTALSSETRRSARQGNSRQVTILPARTETYKRSFSFSALATWNNLPDDVVAAPSFSLFKTKLKVFLKL